MKKSILLLGILAIAHTAQAQTTAREFSIGVEGSYNWAKNESNFDIPGMISNSAFSSSSIHAGGYRIFLGYDLNENIAFELGYFGSGNFNTNGSANVTVQGTTLPLSVNASTKITGGDLSAIYKFTQGLPGLFLKAGATQSKARTSVNLASVGNISIDDSENGMGYLLGVGYEKNLTTNLDGRIAYTLYKNLGGQSDQSMSTISLGLKYRF